MKTRSRPRRAAAHSTVPTVNLLSPWVFEELATRRLRQLFAGATVLLLFLVGAGWTVQHLRTAQAEVSLEAEHQHTAQLTSRTTELAPVRTFVSAVDRQKQVVARTMAHEVYLSRVLTGLASSTPRGAQLENLAVTLTPVTDEAAAGAAAGDATGSAACPGPDPFNTKKVVGCVTLSGSASSRALVGELVLRLGRDPLFVEPFISTTTTAEGDDVLFTGSVGLSERTYSKRYKKIDTLLKASAGR